MKRFLAPFALGAVVVLFLAGCGGGSDHNAQDVTFAKDMVPHHQQAVEMADLAGSRAVDPKVRQIAARIKAAQDPEIRTMQEWLEDWGTGGSMPGMDHGGGSKEMSSGGMGMMSEGEMTALRDASGNAFDRMFLTMMTGHHNGAVDMAKTELEKGKYQPAKDLARAIQDTQVKEVAEMQQILGALPAS